MLIIDSYISAFNAISARHDEEPSDYEIGPNASLGKVIRYTRNYIVESDERHYRYKYYYEALSKGLKRLRFDPGDRCIVHLDLGCGPGLFSWVVHDFMAQKQLDTSRGEFFGYDHANNMIVLARLFKHALPRVFNFIGYSKKERISKAMQARDFSDYVAVVTLGHVLIQVSQNSNAIAQFIQIVQCLLPAHVCFLIAADAFTNGRQLVFVREWERLLTAFANAGVAVSDKNVDAVVRSRASARLHAPRK